MNKTVAKLARIFFIYFTITVTTGLPASAAIFEVTPIGLFFKAGSRTDILTVRNGGDEKLSLQIKAVQWSQEAEGKDSYTGTKDIIFFPKILTLDREEERVVRVGLKVPAEDKEKSYRIFIEELPSQRTLTSTGVRTLVRMGIPVFLEPQVVQAKGVIENLSAQRGGKVSFQVSNKGNIHFIVQTIKVTGYDRSGAEIFSNPVSGWYVHAGISKTYTQEIPRDVCRRIGRVQVDVSTDKSAMSEAIDVVQSVCEP